MAQSAPRMIISDAPHPLIRIERFNPELHKKYALWARPGSSGERAAVVLSNDSDQPILAISSHWTTVGPDGREQGRWEQCENFLTDKGPVVEAHSTVLLGLSLCVGELLAGGGMILSEPKSPVIATEVRVLVGGILFANGELFGTNASDYAQDLNARAAGATKLAADARKLLAQGTSRLEAVTAIDQAAHGMPGKEGASYRMYLRSLRIYAERQPQAFDSYLKSLEQYKLPAPIVVKISGVPGMVKTSDAVKNKQ
ncbi:MAG TPA: hypothetical protein VKU01_14435 [Bryobacteraceae bacterium]|nr:hypothetical protein [Bryobacteraceae bacterium]